VDRVFRELPACSQPGDLLVFNDTRVIKARLLGEKASGGAVEALVERVPANEVLAHLRASKSPKPGSRGRGRDGERLRGRGAAGPRRPDGALFHLRLPASRFALLERHGHVPLPPYITHADSADDERRYQTVFARTRRGGRDRGAALRRGVLAALPSAASPPPASRCTWAPAPSSRCTRTSPSTDAQRVVEVPQATVDADRHARRRRARRRGGHHHAARAGIGRRRRAGPARDTDIFITPGFEFRVVDRLVTNFHLPKSTLMMLVSAFAGHAHVMALYRHAIAQRYRFSYGDAMLLTRAALTAAPR
jgi:S-adenosylmethionine:tRNA ribosyltransferase-isomerase